MYPPRPVSSLFFRSVEHANKLLTTRFSLFRLHKMADTPPGMVDIIMMINALTSVLTYFCCTTMLLIK